MAAGKYDAFLLMPRGARDEEFHTAITELLSDWGSTVADPEVPRPDRAPTGKDALMVALRDFLDRMGMPNRTSPPTARSARAVLDPGRGRRPVRAPAPRGAAMAPPRWSGGSVREVATRIYGARATSTSTRSSTW